jgi:hypothetical protein
MYDTIIVGKPIPLFEKNSRGAPSHSSLVHQALLREFYMQKGPITPNDLTKRVLEAGGVYSREKKVNQVLTHIKELLDNMLALRIIEQVGKVPAKKFGMQNTYSLTTTGKMIVACLFPFDPKDEKAKAARADAAKRYIMLECKKGNTVTDFSYDIMLEMIDAGYIEAVKIFLAQIALLVCQNRVFELYDPLFLDQMGNSWIQSRLPEEQEACARAFLKVLRALPKKQRRWIEMREKYERELRDVRRVPDQDYVRALLAGGELVNIPLWCLKCETKFVARKSVEKIYQDLLNHTQVCCPMCGEEGIKRGTISLQLDQSPRTPATKC